MRRAGWDCEEGRVGLRKAGWSMGVASYDSGGKGTVCPPPCRPIVLKRAVGTMCRVVEKTTNQPTSHGKNLIHSSLSMTTSSLFTAELSKPRKLEKIRLKN